MKLYDRATQEIIQATITTDHPATIPGPLALKRADTGTFIALRELFPVRSLMFFALLEISSEEAGRLIAVGLMPCLITKRMLGEAWPDERSQDIQC